MIQPWTIYDGAGEIQQIVTCAPSQLADYLPPDGGAIAGAFSSDDYIIRENVPVTRPTAPVVIDGLILRGLPIPCVLVVEGQQYACDDGVAEIEFTHPGPYEVRIEAAGFKPRTVTLS